MRLKLKVQVNRYTLNDIYNIYADLLQAKK